MRQAIQVPLSFLSALVLIVGCSKDNGPDNGPDNLTGVDMEITESAFRSTPTILGNLVTSLALTYDTADPDLGVVGLIEAFFRFECHDGGTGLVAFAPRGPRGMIPTNSPPKP